MCRETVHYLLALMGDAETIQKANELFQSQLDGNSISASIKKPVSYSTV